MRLKLNTSYLLPVLVLSACAKPQPSPTVETVVEEALPETTQIAESFTPVASWSDIIAEGSVKDGWLKTFGDEELEKIVAEALANNRELAVAAANLDAAAALATQAGARLIPAVNVGGGAQQTNRGDNNTSTSGAALNM